MRCSGVVAGEPLGLKKVDDALPVLVQVMTVALLASKLVDLWIGVVDVRRCRWCNLVAVGKVYDWLGGFDNVDRYMRTGYVEVGIEKAHS